MLNHPIGISCSPVVTHNKIIEVSNLLEWIFYDLTLELGFESLS